MTIDDIKHLFTPQLNEGMDPLRIVIVQDEVESFLEYPASDLSGLASLLEGCIPAGYGANKTVRFHK